MKYVRIMFILAFLDVLTTQYGIRSGLAVEANPFLEMVIGNVFFNVFKIVATLLTALSIYSKEETMKKDLERNDYKGTFGDVVKWYRKSLARVNATKIITRTLMIFVVCWNVGVIVTNSIFIHLGM